MADIIKSRNILKLEEGTKGYNGVYDKTEFQEFIMERIHRKIDVPQEVKGLINPKLQSMNIPFRYAEEKMDYFHYVESIRKMEKDLQSLYPESKFENGLVADDNFFAFPWQTLHTIPGSCTRHTTPMANRELNRSEFDKFDERAIELIKKLWKEWKDENYDPNTGLKINLVSRSGYFLIKAKDADRFKSITQLIYYPLDGYDYVVDNVWRAEEKVALLRALEAINYDCKPLLSYSFRKDTPDKVKDYQAKIRTYRHMDGSQFDVNPNTPYGILMRSRTVTASSISDNSRLINLANNIIKFFQTMRPWQQDRLEHHLKVSQYIKSLDITNFDLVDSRKMRDLFVSIFFEEGEEYMKGYEDYPLLAWEWNEKMTGITSQILRIKDLKTGTMSGHQLFTTCLNWFNPTIDILANLFRMGLDEDIVVKWLHNDMTNTWLDSIHIESCGDDNGVMSLNEKDEKMDEYVNLFLTKGIFLYELEDIPSVLGQLKSKKGDVSMNVAKGFIKSILDPKNFNSKLKPYAALGWKIKRSIRASYKNLVDNMEKYFPKFTEWVEKAEVPVNLTAVPVRLLDDIGRAAWDPAMRSAGEAMNLFIDITGENIKSRR